MELTKLTAISPIDGRYRNKVDNLSEYFSEYGYIKYRTYIEIEYFIELCKVLPNLKNVNTESVKSIFLNFSIENANRIKELELITNHDIKAIEYFIKEEFEKIGLSEYKEFIHFGLTSQDINNTSIPLLLSD